MTAADFSYRVFFDHVFDPIALYRVKGEERPVDSSRVVFFNVNPAYERVMKVKAEDVIGRSFLDVWPMAEERWASVVVDCVNQGRLMRCEGESRNTRSYLEAVALPLSEGMAAAIFRDRTDWKRSNDALRRCQEDLSALAASRAGKAENAGDEGPTIRLLLADSHDLFVEGVRALIRRTPGLELVGQARDAIEDAEQVLPHIRVDVALIDLSSPLQSGLEALRQLHERFPDVRMLVLSMRGDRDFVAGGLRAGALGYVLKECASEELCRAIRTVAEGQYAIAPSLLPPLVEGYLAAPVSDSEAESGRPPLSERESEVLRLLAGGLSSKQIALQLSISKNTVDTHRRRIFGKVGCNNMVELARWALRNGYL